MHFRTLLIGLSVAVAGIATTIFSATTYYARVSPFSAAFGMQANPLVLLEQVNRVADLDQGAPFSEAIRQQVAKDVLERRPLDPVAVRLLGGPLSADYTKLPEADALDLSQKISRRDRRTQAMLILHAAKNGDVDAALEHIDRSLTVRPSLVEDMSPQLMVLISDEGGHEIAARLADRTWFGGFMSIAISRIEDPSAIARLIYKIEEAGKTTPISEGDLGNLVRRLSNRGNYDDALVIAEKIGLDVATLEQGDGDGFRPNKVNTQAEFTPLTWAMGRALDGEVRLGNDDGLFLEMDAGSRIEALSRVTRLGSGRYVLSMKADEASGPDVMGKWAVECHDGANWTTSWTSGWADIVLGDGADYALTLGASCVTQRWTLQVQLDASGAIG